MPAADKHQRRFFGRKLVSANRTPKREDTLRYWNVQRETKCDPYSPYYSPFESSVMDLKTKEEKDAELDKRIEALRKKNEALVKRYQEIEEDKKKAEQEGIAITTPRKPRPHDPELEKRKQEKENFTVTVDLSKVQEKRVVNDGKPGAVRGQKVPEESDRYRGQSPPRRTGSGRVGQGQRGGGRQDKSDREPRTPREGEPGEAGQGWRGGRRSRGVTPSGGGGGTPVGVDRKSKEWEEKRRQNIEKMNEEMERIAEYERGQRTDGDKPIRNFLDDPRRSGPAPDTDRKEGSRRHVRNWGGLDFDSVKTGPELEKEWTSRRPGLKGSMDMTMSMTGRERAEYLRWKKEREQIDEERLARHRNATGQWRREWDAQKNDNMFKEGTHVTAESNTSEHCGRRDDSKRPPKAPTFGDFLSQDRTQAPRGDRNRGRGRNQKQSYSMHDNRWEAEKDDEKKEKEEKRKINEKEVKSKLSSVQKVDEKNAEAADDEDEWEDASDEEEEQRDPAPTPSSPQSAKEQRIPRPKVHIPDPSTPKESAEGGKPLSPFCPLDHRPVSDWGEEMEMLSPRSSMGGESPLKPPSAETSFNQRKDSEEAGGPSESHKDQDSALPGVEEGSTSAQLSLGSGPSSVHAPATDDDKVTADYEESTASPPGADQQHQFCPGASEAELSPADAEEKEDTTETDPQDTSQQPSTG